MPNWIHTLALAALRLRRYGHVRDMAMSEKKGLEEAGCIVTLRTDSYHRHLDRTPALIQEADGTCASSCTL